MLHSIKLSLCSLLLLGSIQLFAMEKEAAPAASSSAAPSETKTCTICLNPLSEESNVIYAFKCATIAHGLHKVTCFNDYLLKAELPTCPICRAALKKEYKALAAERLHNNAINNLEDDFDGPVIQDPEENDTPHGVGDGIVEEPGAFALAWATQHNNMEILQAAFDQGISANTQDFFGTTALMMAAQEGHVAAAQLLLTHGAMLNMQDTIFGMTALMCAAQAGHRNLVQVLLNHGAQTNLQNADGENAAAIALNHGYDDIAAMISAHEHAHAAQ